MAPTLRDYQLTDLEKVRAIVRRGGRRILFVATVSYGKTAIFSHIAHSYAARGKRVLILAHRTRLVGQAVDRVGSSDLITISTVQGVARRLDRIPAPDVIIVDEAHRGGAGAQYRSIYDAFADALVLGFTGTPTPDLFSVFPVGDMVEGESAAALTASGFLAPIRYYCPSVVDLLGVRTVAGEYDPASLVEALEKSSIAGDAIKSYRGHCAGRPTILFAVNVSHGLSVQKEFAAAGIHAEVITGKDKETEQERKLAHLYAGGLLIAIDTISEGFSFEELHAIISMRPTRSTALWIQHVGRVARAAPGKEFGLVLDHACNTLRHGTITDARDWRTADRPAPKDQVTPEGELLRIRQCESCYFILEAGPAFCPACGVEFAKERRISVQEKVRLEEIQAEELRRRREEMARAKRREEGQAQSFADLQRLERERGYARGWARARWAARQRRAS